jgi:hypothetical protein
MHQENNGTQKNRRSIRTGGIEAPGDFGVSTDFTPSHIGPFLNQTTVGISALGWQPAV